MGGLSVCMSVCQFVCLFVRYMPFIYDIKLQYALSENNY